MRARGPGGRTAGILMGATHGNGRRALFTYLPGFNYWNGDTEGCWGPLLFYGEFRWVVKFTDYTLKF